MINFAQNVKIYKSKYQDYDESSPNSTHRLLFFDFSLDYIKNTTYKDVIKLISDVINEECGAVYSDKVAQLIKRSLQIRYERPAVKVCYKIIKNKLTNFMSYGADANICFYERANYLPVLYRSNVQDLLNDYIWG